MIYRRTMATARTSLDRRSRLPIINFLPLPLSFLPSFLFLFPNASPTGGRESKTDSFDRCSGKTAI